MSHSCHDDGQVAHNKRVLWIVLVLNLAMFALEIWQGIQAGSSSLLADSMDFFGDSLSYVITLFVLHKSLKTRAKASLSKAFIMLSMAMFALSQGVWHAAEGIVPDYQTMSWVGALALIVNATCATLLYGSREDDSNMKSVWLCSRNDMLNNIGVIIAAGMVYATGTLWPDLGLALFICWIETRSAIQIIRQARVEMAD